MTAAEKAQELVNKFRSIDMWDSENPRTEFNHSMAMKYAKQCAIIAVEEKTATLLACIGNHKHFWTVDEKEAFEYLQEVKEEIQKL